MSMPCVCSADGCLLLRTTLLLAAVKAVCSEYRIHNADVHLRDDCDVDDLVDVIEGSRVYIPAIYVINKIDQITLEELNVLTKLPHYCPVCAYHEWNLDGLVDMIWEYLDLLRIYTKPKVTPTPLCNIWRGVRAQKRRNLQHTVCWISPCLWYALHVREDLFWWTFVS